MQKNSKSVLAPVEYYKGLSEYPVDIHIFRKKNITTEQVIARHWHTNIEMTYRIRYSGKLVVNGTQYELSDDSLFIINSGDIHEIHTFPQAEIHAVLVSIPYQFIKNLVPDVDAFHFEAGKNKDNMKKTILKMEHLELSKDAYSHIRMYSLALELIYYMMEDAVPKFYKDTKSADIRIWNRKNDIIVFLNDHICEIKSTEDLCRAFGYSREHFSRFVSNYFGTTCKKLIDQTRLNYAVNYIRNSNRSLAEVSETAGFPSYRNFRSLFKKYYGIYPEQFLGLTNDERTSFHSSSQVFQKGDMLTLK